MTKKGKVYLIGAGPGDPSLFTLKGKDILARADAVVYDYLVNPFLLRYAKKEARFIYVGKKAGRHTLEQDSINRLLVDLSKKGLNVVRLKGGDPFIFGRGAEEALELAKEGIEFEIIPGVTSAIAVAAYAGIPLTHRGYASSVAFITGHEADSKQDLDILWNRIIGAETIVILMGVSRIKHIKERLINAGLSPDTPFAIICNGTLPKQRTVDGILEQIDYIAERNSITPPAIIIIGKTVKLREKISWFEKKPLFGKKIMITRPEDQLDELALPLMEMGAHCILFPTIKITYPDNWQPLDTAINEITIYDWIIFTSVNGVRFFFERLKQLGKDIRELHNIKIGAIGPKTAALLSNIHIKADFIPDEYRAEAIVEHFKSMDVRNMRFLIPRVEVARDYLPEGLKRIGAEVDVIPVYKNILPQVNKEDITTVKTNLINGELDLVIFTSPSTFKNLLKILDIHNNELKRYFHKTKIASIGPVTGEVIKRAGLCVDIIPEKYTISYLIESILKKL